MVARKGACFLPGRHNEVPPTPFWHCPWWLAVLGKSLDKHHREPHSGSSQGAPKGSFLLLQGQRTRDSTPATFLSHTMPTGSTGLGRPQQDVVFGPYHRAFPGPHIHPSAANLLPFGTLNLANPLPPGSKQTQAQAGWGSCFCSAQGRAGHPHRVAGGSLEA